MNSPERKRWGLPPGSIAESDEGKPGVILDYGADGTLLAVEILDASHRMAIPDHVDFEVAAADA
ncbi:MAG: DUF2283 domain-containing protein [Planctomycetia bacterium]